MEIERVLRAIDEGLAKQDISPDHAALLRRMRFLYDKDQESANVRENAQQIRERFAEEARATGERVGTPIGRFLAAMGVTTATPILEVVPDDLSSAPSRPPSKKPGLFGQPRIKGGGVPGLELEPRDYGLAIKAFNLLRREVMNTDPVEAPFFTESSVMGDIPNTNMSRKPGSGPHLLAILNAAVEQLPPPPVVAGE